MPRRLTHTPPGFGGGLNYRDVPELVASMSGVGLLSDWGARLSPLWATRQIGLSPCTCGTDRGA
jgi:hypothetical protein